MWVLDLRCSAVPTEVDTGKTRAGESWRTTCQRASTALIRDCTDLQVVNVGSAVVDHGARSGVSTSPALPRESGGKTDSTRLPSSARASHHQSANLSASVHTA